MEEQYYNSSRGETSQRGLQKSDSHSMLEDLKSRINEINHHINTSKDRMRNISSPKGMNSSVISSSKAQILPISSPKSEYYMLQDDLTRPIYESSQRFVNQKERELREAQERAEKASYDIEAIRKEENDDLERQLHYANREVEKRKHQLRDEFEARLNAIDLEHKEDIVRKRLDTEKRIEKRLQSYHIDITRQANGYTSHNRSPSQGRNVQEFSAYEKKSKNYENSQSPNKEVRFNERKTKDEPQGYRETSRSQLFSSKNRSPYKSQVSPARDMVDVSMNIENRLNSLKQTLDEVRGRKETNPGRQKTSTYAEGTPKSQYKERSPTNYNTPYEKDNQSYENKFNVDRRVSSILSKIEDLKDIGSYRKSP